MKTNEFFYDLPARLIAQTPLADRSASRLMILDKETGATEHKYFRDIADCLNAGDCLVINDTKVIPARLIGQSETGARVEILLLTRRSGHVWETLAKPGKKAKPGAVINFGGGELSARVDEILDDGKRLITFTFNGIFEAVLDKLGKTPLPPYITEELYDENRYQTVYAVHEGSVAAPTAGLHFTEKLLRRIESKNVHIARLTLHVGLGTFRPVKTEDINDHKIHSEYYNIEDSQADIINSARRAGGRIIAVGTTSCRTLESVSDTDGNVHAASGWTDIFIYPGYRFKALDALITNFHLPESTLLMLVSALCRRENIMRAYQEAIDNNYRFFSFGDAMFIK
ncbi:MAG: tRNA preQ1(34) S-adenosylmethionine ribosyltransferase-isomerase QueA [Clostridiales bacterium]|jgi:S-adenosylmethionine:tRNA ribosyltransferase-isomerase|nr:tRNA preQ1(34) S-adenosylmethionine ribosyltransferase-isomerase QueA [Clostridiales bacterium]